MYSTIVTNNNNSQTQQLDNKTIGNKKPFFHPPCPPPPPFPKIEISCKMLTYRLHPTTKTVLLLLTRLITVLTPVYSYTSFFVKYQINNRFSLLSISG